MTKNENAQNTGAEPQWCTACNEGFSAPHVYSSRPASIMATQAAMICTQRPWPRMSLGSSPAREDPAGRVDYFLIGEVARFRCSAHFLPPVPLVLDAVGLRRHPRVRRVTWARGMAAADPISAAMPSSVRHLRLHPAARRGRAAALRLQEPERPEQFVAGGTVVTRLEQFVKAPAGQVEQVT